MTDFQAYDLVQETTTTTGTGTLTLSGASVGFQSFAVVGDGVQCRYSIQAVDSNNNPTGDYEVGQGTYTSSGTTLSRAVVEASSNSNSPVNLTAGTKIVRLVFSATQCNTFGAAGTAHWPGAVPDPGGTVHTPCYVLGDDGAWHVASGVAIGGAVGSGTATYVLFVDASGNLGQSSGLTFNTSGQLAVNTGGTFYATIGGSNAAQYNDGSGNVVVIGSGTYAAQFNDGSSNVVVICNGTCAAQFTDGSGNVVVICNGTYAI